MGLGQAISTVRYSIPALLKGKANRMFRHSAKLSRSKTPPRDARTQRASSCFLACVTLPPNLPLSLSSPLTLNSPRHVPAFGNTG